MSGFSDYGKYDGLGLADLVRKKEVTPSELVEEAIGRIEQLNPQLNAVIYKMYDLARGMADSDLPDGPFQGVPFLLKDLLAAFAGVPLRMGAGSTSAACLIPIARSSSGTRLPALSSWARPTPRSSGCWG